MTRNVLKITQIHQENTTNLQVINHFSLLSCQEKQEEVHLQSQITR